MHGSRGPQGKCNAVIALDLSRFEVVAPVAIEVITGPIGMSLHKS